MATNNIVFLPALMCTASLYKHQYSFFTKKNYNVFSFYNFVNNNLSAIASNIAMQIKAINNNQPVILAGTSMGGYIALQIALDFPNLVQNLILINTTIFTDNPTKKANRINTINNATAQTDEQFNNSLHLLNNILPAYFYNYNQHNYNLIKNMHLQLGKSALINQQTAILNRPDFSQQVNKFKFKTLIVASANDTIINLTESQQMHKTIPNSTLQVINKCGHLSPLNKPNTLNKTIYNWITNNNA